MSSIRSSESSCRACPAADGRRRRRGDGACQEAGPGGGGAPGAGAGVQPVPGRLVGAEVHAVRRYVPRQRDNPAPVQPCARVPVHHVLLVCSMPWVGQVPVTAVQNCTAQSCGSCPCTLIAMSRWAASRRSPAGCCYKLRTWQRALGTYADTSGMTAPAKVSGVYCLLRLHKWTSKPPLDSYRAK